VQNMIYKEIYMA